MSVHTFVSKACVFVGSGEGRQCGRDHNNNLFRRKNMRMGDMEQDTHTQRERERHKYYLLLETVTTMSNQPLQKVTKSLYIIV